MRYLAITALAFSAAMFAANYILPTGVLLWLAATLAVLGLLLLFVLRRHTAIRLLLFGVALGFAVFFAHASFTAIPAGKLDGETIDIEAIILDYPKVYDDYGRLEIELAGDGLPHISGYLYDNDLTMTELHPGERISLTVSMRSADTRYGKDYDFYNSRDIYFIASAKSVPLVTEGDFCLAVLPAFIRHRVLELMFEIFPENCSHFMASLLMGEKTELYKDTALYSDLSRAGLMHVAAVSGMHIAFLVGMIQLLFGYTAGSSVFCIVLVWAFALLTGASPSAVRAAFMQSLLLMAPLLRRENDPITSLSTALAMVLFANPYAAASVSLQLSFGAMAGILCFSAPVSRCLESMIPSKSAARILRYPLGILSVSLSVMVFTLPLCAVHFGYVSILSPITNMLALWAVSLCFMGGFICCVLGSVFPGAAGLLALPVSWLARYIFFAARLVSDIPFAVIYINNKVLAAWFMLLYVFVALSAASQIKPELRLILPLLLSALTLFSALGFLRAGYERGAGSIAVLDVGQGQSIAAISGDSCVVIDCGGGGRSENAGETAGAYLLTRGVGEIDVLLLTHLHSDHANGTLNLMELVEVKKICMPSDPPDEDKLLEPILEAARRHGTEICYISEDEDMAIGRLRMELYAPGSRGEANERCVMCRLYIDDYDMLITADSSSTAEREFIKKYDLDGLDALIAGHHGSRYSSCGDFLEYVSADTAIISAGYNTYGHPTHEVLARLDAYGYNIYRTDLNGTVEIRIG